jgi:beta-carotene ketolase (CrtO type)
VEELELTKYGLEYLYCDPVVFCPHPDGKYFLGHKSVEKTCAEIARYNTRDAEKYAEFIDFWQRLLKGIVPIFNAPPKSVIDIVGNYDLPKLKDLFSVVGLSNKTLDLIRTMLSSAEDMLNELYDSEFVKAPLARLASELGAPPSQKNLPIPTCESDWNGELSTIMTAFSKLTVRCPNPYDSIATNIEMSI